MSKVEERHYLMNGGETLPDAREALEWASETRASMVDLKFCDLLGTLAAHHAADAGIRRGGLRRRPRLRRLLDPRLAGIQDSDMLLMPDASSAILDPATEAPTLSLVCEIADPVTREPYAKDPRGVARRAEEHLRSTGIADTAYFGPECEFFVFDEVSTTSARTAPTTRSTRPRVTGTRANPASATRCGRRRATSRRRRTTRSPTSARRWC